MMALTLAERRAVTETTAIRNSLADKRTKGIILDELCATTGLSPARVMGPLVCHEYGTGSFRLLAVC